MSLLTRNATGYHAILTELATLDLLLNLYIYQSTVIDYCETTKLRHSIVTLNAEVFAQDCDVSIVVYVVDGD